MNKNKAFLPKTDDETDNPADKMILSHLSSKRKEFVIERFDKIMDRMDKMIEPNKKNTKADK